jgi:hypothetical protein
MVFPFNCGFGMDDVEVVSQSSEVCLSLIESVFPVVAVLSQDIVVAYVSRCRQRRRLSAKKLSMLAPGVCMGKSTEDAIVHLD